MDKIYKHPEYSDGQGYFDMAIIKVTFVEFSNTVKPICLPEVADPLGTNLYDKSATVAGRGIHDNSGSSLTTLKTADLVVRTAR